MAEEPDTREQLEGLIRENRTLAETIEGLREELESLQASLQNALQARQSAEQETEQAKQENAEMQGTVSEPESVDPAILHELRFSLRSGAS
jgi:cell division septum initiation protein DivIVA